MNTKTIKIDIWIGYTGTQEKRDQIFKFWGSEMTKQGMPENNFAYYQGQKRLGNKYYNAVAISGDWKEAILHGIKASETTIELIKGIQISGVEIDTVIKTETGLIKNPRSFLDNGFRFYYVGKYEVLEC